MITARVISLAEMIVMIVVCGGEECDDGVDEICGGDDDGGNEDCDIIREGMVCGDDRGRNGNDENYCSICMNIHGDRVDDYANEVFIKR